MAKYYVTYSCGHEGTVELFGKETDRQRKIEWYESEGLCPECYKALQEAELDKFDDEHKLPTLEGSEKQVKYARDLRKAYIVNNPKWAEAIMNVINDSWNEDELRANADKMGKTVEEIKQMLADNAKKNAMYTVFTTTSAKWIIENAR